MHVIIIYKPDSSVILCIPAVYTETEVLQFQCKIQVIMAFLIVIKKNMQACRYMYNIICMCMHVCVCHIACSVFMHGYFICTLLCFKLFTASCSIELV